MTISATYWEVGGKRIFFPLERFEESIEKRIGRHRRMFKNGARLDIVGRNERVWRATIPFYDTCEDQHVKKQGRALYTEVLPEFIALFDKNETGNLMTTRGLVRAVADTLRIVEVENERLAQSETDQFAGPQNETTGFSLGVAAVEATWIEDTEDDDATVSDAPSTKAMAYLTAKLSTSMEDEGIATGSFAASLREWTSFADNPMPEEAVYDYVKGLADSVTSAIQTVENAFLEKYATVENLGAENKHADVFGRESAEQTRPGPRLHSVMRLCSRIKNQVARTVELAERARPAPTVRVYRSTVSVFQVAADTGSRIEDVLAANGALDPFALSEGVPVVTFPRRR